MTPDEAKSLGHIAGQIFPRSQPALVAALILAIEPYPHDVVRDAIMAHAQAAEFLSIPTVLALAKRAVRPAAPPARPMTPAEIEQCRRASQARPPDQTVEAVDRWADAIGEDELERIKAAHLEAHPELAAFFGQKRASGCRPLRCVLFDAYGQDKSPPGQGPRQSRGERSMRIHPVVAEAGWQRGTVR